MEVLETHRSWKVIMKVLKTKKSWKWKYFRKTNNGSTLDMIKKAAKALHQNSSMLFEPTVVIITHLFGQSRQVDYGAGQVHVLSLPKNTVVHHLRNYPPEHSHIYEIEKHYGEGVSPNTDKGISIKMDHTLN